MDRIYKEYQIIFIYTFVVWASVVGHSQSVNSTLTFGQILRGPYLQIATDTSIVIRWRTADTCNAQVRYGKHPSLLDKKAEDTTLTRDHVVCLGNLDAETKYYYTIGKVGESPMVGTDTAQYFKTHPPKGSERPVLLWALGDAGKTVDEQRWVRDAYISYKKDRPTDLWLLLGDNAYTEGTDAEYQYTLFENMFEQQLKNTTLWPCPGNHDLRSYMNMVDDAPYFKIFSTPLKGEAGGVPSCHKAYYSFDYANVHLISLDSYGSPRYSTQDMATWLKADLAANARKWVIAYWHHPPYTKGTHDSDVTGGDDVMCMEMREQILPILEQYGVDLVLNGHSHSYERSYMVHGYYGNSAAFAEGTPIVNEQYSGKKELQESYYKNPIDPKYPNVGCVYTVMGCSGYVNNSTFWQSQPDNLITNGLMYTSLCTYTGSLVVEINEDTLQVGFLDNTGVMRDDFSIIKDSTKEIKLASANIIAKVDSQVSEPLSCFTVFPNPYEQSINIKYRVPERTKISIQLWDAEGKKIKTLYTDKQDAGLYEQEFFAEQIPPQATLITLKIGKELCTQQIMKGK